MREQLHRHHCLCAWPSGFLTFSYHPLNVVPYALLLMRTGHFAPLSSTGDPTAPAAPMLTNNVGSLELQVEFTTPDETADNAGE